MFENRLTEADVRFLLLLEYYLMSETFSFNIRPTHLEAYLNQILIPELRNNLKYHKNNLKRTFQNHVGI